MKLQKAIFFNRAPFDRLEIDFENSKTVFVLSGINGKGKTTVLSYIADSLYELSKKAFFNEFEGRINKFYRVSSILDVLDKTMPSIVYLRYIYEDKQFDYVDFHGTDSKQLNEKIYNTAIYLDGKIPFKSIEWHLNNTPVVKLRSEDNNKEIVEIFSKCILTYFPAYRYEIPSYLNDPYKIDLKFKTNPIFSGYLPNKIEVTTSIDEIANRILDVILDDYVYKKNKTNKLNEILNLILKSKLSEDIQLGTCSRKNSAERISIIKVKDHKQIYPSIFAMSSGELALFSLFAELIKQDDNLNNGDFVNGDNEKDISNISGIVLVDEIEKHLHIKMQKEVLPQLIKLFPNLQFILTSHSPFLSLGLEESHLNYQINDFDKGATICEPQNNDLFKGVYDLFIAENEKYIKFYNDLSEKFKKSTRPLIITEGKTDWKHIKAAMKALKESLDIEFFEYVDDNLGGDDHLDSILKNYSKIPIERKIIGIFDRDNEHYINKFNCDKSYYSFNGNVFAFCIPKANENIYGEYTSIEHYYNKDNLLKKDERDHRLFLGNEFEKTGIGKDGKIFVKATKDNKIINKIERNGIIDDKVYNLLTDKAGNKNIAMSKNDFASKIYDSIINEKGDYAKDFDFKEFKKIFDVIRKIIEHSNKD